MESSSHPSTYLAHESRFPEILAILATGCILTTTVVGLRCFTRLRLLKIFGPDDAVMAVAQVLVIGSAVAEGLESKFGLGRHIWTIPASNTIPYLKSFYSSIVVYNVAMCLVKISILLQYRRLFSGVWMKRLTLGLLVFFVAWTITLAFMLSLVCVPVAAFWDPHVPGRCLNMLTIWYVMAGVNLVSDFTLFSMPLPIIRSLALPTKQKVLLSLVFGLGFLTCAISIIRVQTLRVAADTNDPTWDNVGAATWSFLELTTAVLAACLPTLRPLLAHVMPHTFGSSLANKYSSNGAANTTGEHLNAKGENEASSLRGADGEILDGPRLNKYDVEMGLNRPETAANRPVTVPKLGYTFKITAGSEARPGTARPNIDKPLPIVAAKSERSLQSETPIIKSEIVFDKSLKRYVVRKAGV